MNYVFGPVPSRRLGRSLGVDLVPFKTCSFDCIYCQLGPTTCKTAEFQEGPPLDEVVAQVAARLESKPDYVTLSGSGEPTLYAHLAELVLRLKALTDVPVAVLTNGSLLWNPDVRKALLPSDLVIPSLDAGDEATFKIVNRPHESLNFEQMVEGLVDFRKEFSGQLWLEVMVLEGLTDSEETMTPIAELARRIGPDRVQLNTATRPTAFEQARPVPAERLAQLARLFSPAAEPIADYQGTHQAALFAGERQAVLELLQRRPCTLADVAEGLGLHLNQATKHLEELVAEGKAEEIARDGHVYFRVRKQAK